MGTSSKCTQSMWWCQLGHQFGLGARKPGRGIQEEISEEVVILPGMVSAFLLSVHRLSPGFSYDLRLPHAPLCFPSCHHNWDLMHTSYTCPGSSMISLLLSCLRGNPFSLFDGSLAFQILLLL